MPNQKIVPEKITKPIQLLAAWLTGLVLVNGTFLLTASKIGIEHWSSSVLIVASVVNVPVFLIAIFLLQTKFRPEMQEDVYYSKYLQSQVSVETGRAEEINKGNKDAFEMREKLSALTQRIDSITTKMEEEKSREEVRKLSDFATEIVDSIDFNSNTVVHINDLLPSYIDLRGELVKHGVKINKIFGSSSEEAIVPSVFAVTCGDGIDVQLFQTIVKVSLKYGASKVGFSTDVYSYGQVYIGSYAYQLKRRLYSLEGAVYESIMKPNLTMPELKAILTKE